MPRVRGILLQFSSQLRDVRVNCAGDDGVGVTPHLAHELQTRDDRAPAPHERQKKLVLPGSDLDLDVAEPLDRGRRRPRRAGKPSTLFAAALLSATDPTQAPSPQTTPVPSAATTSIAPDAAAKQNEALNGIRQRIKGRENEPAETVFKNIELLKGKPASRLPGMMSALTGLIGVPCATCHVPDRWESDELAPKQTARRHFKMQADLNRDYFGGANAVSCWTCHRGARIPPIQ
jgi:hypothetical protein